MKNKEIVAKIESGYILTFFVYLMLNSILPYVAMKLSIVSAIFMVVGMGILMYHLVFNRKKYAKNNVCFLWLFVIVCILSSISMIQYGYIDNIKTIIWSLITFGVIYLYASDKQEIQIKTILKYLIIIVSCLWGIAIIIGLYQYCMRNKLFGKIGRTFHTKSTRIFL